jgi:hypothetical protein
LRVCLNNPEKFLRFEVLPLQAWPLSGGTFRNLLSDGTRNLLTNHSYRMPL